MGEGAKGLFCSLIIRMMLGREGVVSQPYFPSLILGF